MKLACLRNRLILHPVLLRVILVCTHLIPTVLLLYSEPQTLMEKVILSVFTLGFYVFLFSLHRNAGLIQLLLFPLVFLHAFQIVVFSLFKESVIAVDMFLNLMTTNATEAGELLDNMLPAIGFVCVVYIPVILLSVVNGLYGVALSTRCQRKGLAAASVLMVISATLMFLPLRGVHINVWDDLYPVNVFNNLHLAVVKWNKSETYKNNPPAFSFHARKASVAHRREIYVLVIGEAGRAENWSLSGYPRETNPELSLMGGLVYYRDAITQANATHKSVPLILSAAHAENFELLYRQRSVITAFKESGFTTLFLSNQPPNRSFTDVFAREADHYLNIRQKEGEELVSQNRYDADLLPLLQEYLDTVSGNVFVVFHSYGSHFNYMERYPSDFSYFKPDCFKTVSASQRQEMVNAYDNSIRYTDYFLSRLIDILRATGDCAALYYTTDHGEDLMDDGRERFLHASPKPTYHQLHIPMFLWFSEPYRIDFPHRCANAQTNHNAPTSTRSSFHTLIDMAGIETEYLDTRYSLVSADYTPMSRFYLNDHDQSVRWVDSGLKDCDKDEINRHGLNTF